MTEVLNSVAKTYGLPVIVSTHPRTKKRLDSSNSKFDPQIRFLKPLGFQDYVKLENGTEGEVDDIDWRSTRIRTNANSSVIVPNSKVAQSAITNYCLPEKRVTTTLNIFLTLDSDTDLAEKILIDEARRGSEDIVGLLANPSPQVRFGTPAPEAALQLQLIFQVREFQDQGFVLHELRKRIYRQFKKSGISLYQRNFA